MTTLIRLIVACLTSFATSIALAQSQCIPTWTDVFIPDNNNNNPASPFPIGQNGGECACGSFSFTITGASPNCDVCKYTVSATFRDCATYTDEPCYRVNFLTHPYSYSRTAGAPDCCGPATLPHTAPDSETGKRYNKLVTPLVDKPRTTGAGVECRTNEPQLCVMTFVCPAQQSGDPNITADTCDDFEDPWSGTLLTFTAVCNECP